MTHTSIDRKVVRTAPMLRNHKRAATNNRSNVPRRLTKKQVERGAKSHEQRAGTHRRGHKIVVAQFHNTFGTGDSKAAALSDLCERLNAK